MPRPLPESQQAKAERQARYRAQLASRREPEADRVDTALAATVAAFATMVDEELATPENKRFLKIILQSSLDLLKSQGFAKEASVKVLRRRLSPIVRDDLPDLVERSKIRIRMSQS